MQWAPTYFNQVLGVPLGSVGTYLAVPATINLVGNILIAMLESFLVSRKVGELAIRKGASTLAAATQAVSIVLFGLARTPFAAMLAYCGVVGGGCLHNSGYAPNYLEVGGPDTGVVSAVGNTLANVPGMLGPIVAVWAVKDMGNRASWMPLFAATAGIQAVAAAFFQLCASTRPARDTLAAAAR
jgi:ACS family sodium-dependent inorganic phosphate cotransporter